jgi:C4-dicarboxylate-specific signal transduction histidine kinase
MVRSQNIQGMTLEQIKVRDIKWQETSGFDPFMESLMSNSAAKELLRLERSAPYYLEFFLMDAQGANVAMTNKTSDYWQGDEQKFTKSFNDGAGGVHVSPIQLDSSSQAHLIQISVPVLDAGEVIGALTVGVNLDKLGR